MDAVVVTFNSAPELERMLDCEPLTSAIDQLVVVDNDSRDHSVAVAEKAGALVHRRSTRSGYGAAVNLGSLDTRGPLFAVLNPDVRFSDPDALSRLSRSFEDPRVAIAAPTLQLPTGKPQDSARRVPTPADLLLRRWVARERGAVSGTGVVPWVVGACLVVRREAFESVGRFDEGYDLYFEDVDLCVRLRQAGWSIVRDTSVTALHDHRAASRASVFAWPGRAHLRAATRFYRRHPRYIFGRELSQAKN